MVKKIGFNTVGISYAYPELARERNIFNTLHAFDSIRRTSRQRKIYICTRNTPLYIRRYVRVIHHRTCMDMNMA